MRLRRVLTYVEMIYAAASLGMAIALIFLLGPVGNATNGTSIRILGGAVLALGVGALSVARDPVGNRVIVKVQVVFMIISALALGWKSVVDDSERALLILVPLVVFVALLLAVSPGARPDVRLEEPGPSSRR